MARDKAFTREVLKRVRSLGVKAELTHATPGHRKLFVTTDDGTERTFTVSSSPKDCDRTVEATVRMVKQYLRGREE